MAKMLVNYKFKKLELIFIARWQAHFPPKMCVVKDGVRVTVCLRYRAPFAFSVSLMIVYLKLIISRPLVLNCNLLGSSENPKNKI